MLDLSDPDHPRFTIHDNVAWDYLELDSAARQLAAGAAAICFGTLAQRNQASRTAVQGLLSAAANDCLLVYDVNLRPPWLWNFSSSASAQRRTLMPASCRAQNSCRARITSQ